MSSRQLRPVFTDYIPPDLEDGTLYVSMEYATASHAQTLADAGYFSEANTDAAHQAGTDPFIATGRPAHGDRTPDAPRGPIPKDATPTAVESGLQVSGGAECCRSTVRNRCVTNQLVGGLCDSAWSNQP